MSNKKIKRGRTGSDLTPAQAMTDQGISVDSREESAHSAGRPERVSMQNMKKLHIPPHLIKEGYYHRWFQDRDGRVMQAKTGPLYEHVTDDEGNNLTVQSGPYKMYAMRLKQEYRDADNRLKKARVAATMEAEAAIGPGEYAPDQKTGRAEGGTSAVNSTVSDNPYS